MRRLLTAQEVIVGPKRLFKSVDLTSVNLTVLDSEGRLVHGLEQDAFEVLEDGQPQTITSSPPSVCRLAWAQFPTPATAFVHGFATPRVALDRFLFGSSIEKTNSSSSPSITFRVSSPADR